MAADPVQRWRVTAPLVMVPSAVNSGISGVIRMVGVAEGGILPADVDPERIGHLLRHDMIELVDEAGA